MIGNQYLDDHDCFFLILAFLSRQVVAISQAAWEKTVAFLVKGGAPTYEELNNLKYVEACVREAQRLYATVPLVSRVITKELKIGTKDYIYTSASPRRSAPPRLDEFKMAPRAALRASLGLSQR